MRSIIASLLVTMLAGCAEETGPSPGSTPDPATQQPVSEDQKIETLIASLRKLKGATFIRNGKEHTTEEAVTHMIKKWKWKRKEIKTANDFIRIVGTKSSTSGKAYIIRQSDGTEIETATWFRERLKTIEATRTETEP